MTHDSNDQEFRDRMTTLGEMAAVLAHEIKNPMNSIIINMEVLKGFVQDMAKSSQNPSSEKALKYFNVVSDEIRRLDKVIQNFLELAAPAKPTKALFSLNQVVQKCIDLLKAEFDQKSIRFELQISSELPRLLGIEDQIRQALLNLFINSSQAMPQGGRILIETGFDEKTIFIRVSDNGMGIDDRIRAKIFSPHFTTKEKGSGLGLAIVRRIVREHGGFVELQSELNKGSSFQLVFPRSGAEK